MRLEYVEVQKAIELHKKFLAGDPEGQKANLTEANMYGANLIGVNLKDAVLEKANLKRALLCNANLVNTDLRGAFFKRAILEGTNLQGANLQGANLKGANLDNTNLCGTNFDEADLEDVTVHSAQFDSETHWPEGFDPLENGAVQVNKQPFFVKFVDCLEKLILVDSTIHIYCRPSREIKGGNSKLAYFSQNYASFPVFFTFYCK